MVLNTKRSARRGPVGSKTRRSRRKTRRSGGLRDEMSADALESLRTAHMMLDSVSSPLKHALINLKMARNEGVHGKSAEVLDSLIRKIDKAVQREEYVREKLSEMVKGVSAKDLARRRIGQKSQ